MKATPPYLTQSGVPEWEDPEKGTLAAFNL